MRPRGYPTNFSSQHGPHHLSFCNISARLTLRLFRLSSAERDYVYLSAMKKYATYESILKQTFFRVLFQAGISSPHTFATQDDVDFLVASYRKLRPRPGMPEMFQNLREAGFKVYCCTDASPDRVKGYFDQAGVDMPAEMILSADEVGVGKPEAPVYKMAREKVGADLEGAVTVFAAAHAWDCGVTLHSCCNHCI